MDYIIGDPVVTPLEHSGHFVEKIAQMPVCYQPNDRQRPRPLALSRAEVGLPETAVVLCGFNQAYKISPEVLDVWCDLLRQLPESVLWLLDWHGQARPNLEREIKARGIALDRVYWAPKVGLAAHISRLRLADVFMDTWPYNAHTTCSDALWAGLPVVTYEGQTFACRVASSLLRACGLAELVTSSLKSYCDSVVRLARDPKLRISLRAKLDGQRECGPLFDSARFTQDFQNLIIRMSARNKEGGAACHLLPELRCNAKIPIAVVVPIFKDKLSELECFSLKTSLGGLNQERDVIFVAPYGLDVDWYLREFKRGVFLRFPDHFFSSVQDYSKLMLSSDFYDAFSQYEFILILQTDAIILTDELDFWVSQPYDYVGAPWPDGFEVAINADKFSGDLARKARSHIGNGGLSLRRVAKCVELLAEFPEVVRLFVRNGVNEDLFFGVVGQISSFFNLPGEMIAAKFSLELRPEFYMKISGGVPPMGGHAWWRYNPDFWLKLFSADRREEVAKIVRDLQIK